MIQIFDLIDNWNLCRSVNIHTHIKGSVGLTLVNASVIRVAIPLDLSTRFFIPPPCFLRCRRPPFPPHPFPRPHPRSSVLCPKWHMMCAHVRVWQTCLFIIVLAWQSCPSGLRLFPSAVNTREKGAQHWYLLWRVSTSSFDVRQRETP